jgi:hypothetical protein
MKCNASLLKSWCDENITPMAWQRIVMKALPKLREKGLSLGNVENPDANLVLDEELSEVIKVILQELYQTDIPAKVFVN